MALPSREFSAEEADVRAGLPAGWTRKHSGVTRRFFVNGETASELGAAASRQALETAGLRLREIDAIICCAGTMQQPIPCNAALLARELGPEADSLTAFDVNSTCLGFLTALDVVSAQIMAGSYRRALIVAAEAGSPGLDWSEPESCTLIGDGAAAVILEKADPGILTKTPGVAATLFRTYPAGAHLTEIRGGGTALPAARFPQADPRDYLFQMDGRGVFRMASEHLPVFVESFFEKHHLAWRDFALVIPHQASLTSLALLRRRLGIPEERFLVYGQDYGNTIAASLPMGLHLASAQGRLRRGDRVLLIGTSAGFSMGAVVLDW